MSDRSSAGGHPESSGDTDSCGGDAGAVLDDLPQLHYWRGSQRVGGLNRMIGERIITELGRYDSPRIVETGAGATTLLFCCLEPDAVTSIAPDDALRDRILTEASAREISVEPLRFFCERSEIVLPRLAADGEEFHAALIDGSHSWPSVFVDFCYMNMMLRSGGTLFVDDVQLYSVAQLYFLLRQQREFEYVALDRKLATFRKLTDRPFLSELRRQPYLRQNTVFEPGRSELK